MLNANNSSMNGDPIHAKMETTFKKFKNNTRIFSASNRYSRKIRIFSMSSTEPEKITVL